ncbi:hypothetical protein [Streptomyces sp. NPDC091259]
MGPASSDTSRTDLARYAVREGHVLVPRGHTEELQRQRLAAVRIGS